MFYLKEFFLGIGAKIAGIPAALKGMSTLQMVVAGTAAVVTIGGVGAGGYATYQHFNQPAPVYANIVLDTEQAEVETATEQLVAEALSDTEMIEETETETETETEAEVTDKTLTLVGSSIEKDLKIKIQNSKSRNVKGENFVITIATDKKGSNAVTYNDTDKDGIIYISSIDPGTYYVSLNEIKGFERKQDYIQVTVKDKIEYTKVDVADEIKAENEVSAAEDAQVDNIPVESIAKDTVESLASSTGAQTVSGTDVDTSNFTKASATETNTVTCTNKVAFAVDNGLSLSASSVVPVQPEEGTQAPTPVSSESSTQTPETPSSSENSTQTPETPSGSESSTPAPATEKPATEKPKDINYQIIHEFSDGKASVKQEGTVASGTSVAYQTFEGYTTTAGTSTTITESNYVITVKWTKTVTTVAYTINHYVDNTLNSSMTQTGSGAVGEVVTAKDYTGTYTTTSALSMTLKEKETENVLNVYWVSAGKGATVSVPKTVTLYNYDVPASSTLAITTTIADESGMIKDITWSSSNEKIAKVSAGSKAGVTISRVSAGTAVVTGTITYFTDAKKTVTATTKITCNVSVTAFTDDKTVLIDKNGRGLYTDKTCTTHATLKNYKPDGTYYTGAVYTGWQTIDGKVYYFDSHNKPVTGSQVISGVTYTFGADGALSQGSGSRGIDVSKWQGTIDWNAVKNSGINFAIIRVGYRGAISGALVEDSYFKKNIKGATAAGIKVGVYFFTQAVTEAEAVEEASMTLSLISGYNLSYPIFIDTESATNGRANGLSASARTACVAAFCKTIQNSGRKAGVYASKSWYQTKLNAGSLSSYYIWVAQYNSTCTYSGKYNLWQYSSKGSVAGIKGNVDMNISYMGY